MDECRGERGERDRGERHAHRIGGDAEGDEAAPQGNVILGPRPDGEQPGQRRRARDNEGRARPLPAIGRPHASAAHDAGALAGQMNSTFSIE
jgi:hypothetical protein